MQRTSSSPDSRTPVHYCRSSFVLLCTGGEVGVVDESAGVAERGVLTASAEDWAVAVRRAEVIGRLAREPRIPVAVADEAAAELGIGRRQVYVLVKRWRSGSGVASDLLARRSSGGRGRGRLPAEVEALLLEVIRSRYLSRQRRTVSAVYKEVVRQCRPGGCRCRRGGRWSGGSDSWIRWCR